MNLLLDTAVFLWFVTGDRRVAPAIVNMIADPEREVFLSTVSTWEIAIKHSLGKLELPEAPITLIPRIRADHRIAELPLEEAATLRWEQLPDVHRDPFDRMLVCQAIENGLTVVTPDAEIQRYPVRTVWG